MSQIKSPLTPLTATPESGSSAIDIGPLLNHGRITFLQQFVVVLIALIIIVEGIDIQLFSYALPQILRDWQMERQAFGLAATANSVGLFAGTLMSGYIADKMGRRCLLLMSLFLCGVATFMVGLAGDVNQMAFWRLVTGIGIGGALPVCTTMIAEFAPQRYRTFTVTLSIICIPLGGILAGFFADLVLQPLGWEKAFFIGGLTPLGLWLVCLLRLPESPRFLSRNPARWGELCHLLQLLGKPVAPQSRFVDREESYQGGQTKFDLTTLFAKGLFARGLARDTLALWLLFFSCMIASYAIFAWLPTMLESSGVATKQARFSLILYNAGGIVGIAICAQILARFGSRLAMSVCALGGLVTLVPLLWLDSSRSVNMMLSLITLHGVFANAVQSALYALAAHLYVTQIRATGTTTALVSGRIGGIIAIYSSAHLGGFSGYLTLLIAAMALPVLVIILMRRHIAPLPKIALPPKIASPEGQIK